MKGKPISRTKELVSTPRTIFKKPATKAQNMKKSSRKTLDDRLQGDLVKAYADAVEQSKTHIRHTVTTGMEQASAKLSKQLDQSHQTLKAHFDGISKDLHSATAPLAEQILDWDCSQRERSGKTTMGSRMHKFRKALRTEEETIARLGEEMVAVQAEIAALAGEVLGTGVTGVQATDLSGLGCIERENGELRAKVEAIRASGAEALQQAESLFLTAMEESEKDLNLRQVRNQESFYAILRSDEE